MNLLLSTWLALALAHAKGPPMPDVLAAVTVASSDGEDQVSLTLHKAFKNRVLGEPARHLDPVSTQLEPRPVAGAGTVYWLVGHGLEDHDSPGDTVVTYSLLLEVQEASGSVRALWWENHMEVPTSLFSGEGELLVHGDGAHLELKMTHTEHGDALALSGALHGIEGPKGAARP